MATIFTLLLMTLVFVVSMYTAKWWWLRKIRNSGIHPIEVTFELLPPKVTLQSSVVAGALALLSGVAFLQCPPVVNVTQGSVAKPRPRFNPDASVTPVISTDPPSQIRVVINSSDVYDIPPEALSSCLDTEVIHITSAGQVECLAPDSQEARELLRQNSDLAPLDRLSVPVPEVQRQGIFFGFMDATTAVPDAVQQELSKRTGFWDRYAEVFYFFFTYLGVFMRLTMDAFVYKPRGRKKKPEVLTIQSFIFAFVVSIGVYVLVLQTSMPGGGKTLTFTNGIVAVFNGISWPVLIKDVSALRDLASSSRTPPSGSAPTKPAL